MIVVGLPSHYYSSGNIQCSCFRCALDQMHWRKCWQVSPNLVHALASNIGVWWPFYFELLRHGHNNKMLFLLVSLQSNKPWVNSFKRSASFSAIIQNEACCAFGSIMQCSYFFDMRCLHETYCRSLICGSPAGKFGFSSRSRGDSSRTLLSCNWVSVCRFWQLCKNPGLIPVVVLSNVWLVYCCHQNNSFIAIIFWIVRGYILMCVLSTHHVCCFWESFFYNCKLSCIHCIYSTIHNFWETRANRESKMQYVRHQLSHIDWGFLAPQTIWSETCLGFENMYTAKYVWSRLSLFVIKIKYSVSRIYPCRASSVPAIDPICSS